MCECYSARISMTALLAGDFQAAENQLIEAIRVEHPERVERQDMPDPDDLLKRIGVTFLDRKRPRGYLRLYPHDFNVEEIGLDGVRVPLIPTDVSKDVGEVVQDRRTLWADLIKVNIPAPAAFRDLQKILALSDRQIGYAGIKDAVALTAQRLSLRGVTKEQVENFSHPRMLLRFVRYGNGALQPGSLKGNRFTIVVRSDADASLDQSLGDLQQSGFLNFFGTQRFGSRTLSHELGKLALRGDMEALLRTYFGKPGPFDVPIYRDVRLAMDEVYGDWAAMKKIASHFPFTFHDELLVLDELERRQSPSKALGVIHDQVRLWMYAYASWLANQRLSLWREQNAALPEEMTMPLSPKGLLPEYKTMMERDGTAEYLQALKVFPFISCVHRTMPVCMMPKNLEWKRIPQGWIIRFSLGKGAYATSCLSHAFRLYEGLPLPTWVPTEDVDPFTALGDASLDPFRQRFADALQRRDARAETNEAEE